MKSTDRLQCLTKTSCATTRSISHSSKKTHKTIDYYEFRKISLNKFHKTFRNSCVEEKWFVLRAVGVGAGHKTTSACHLWNVYTFTVMMTSKCCTAFYLSPRPTLIVINEIVRARECEQIEYFHLFAHQSRKHWRQHSN